MYKISLWLIVFVIVILSNCPSSVSKVVNQDPRPRQIRLSPSPQIPRSEKKVEPSQEKNIEGTLIQTQPETGKKEEVGKKMPAERIEKKGGPQRIELNFEGAPLGEVIRTILGDYLHKNYTIEPNLNPGLTLFIRGKYTDSELFNLLRQALNLNNIDIIEKNGMYFLVRKEKAAQFGLTVVKESEQLPEKMKEPAILIYRLSYIEPDMALKTIKPFLSSGAPTVVNKAISGIILADEIENIKTTLQILQTLDTFLLKDVYIETISLKNMDAETVVEKVKNVFSDLSILKNNPKLKENTLIMPIEKTNYVLVVTLNPELLSELKKWIEVLDSVKLTEEQNLYVRFIENGLAKDIADILNEVYETGVARTSEKATETTAKTEKSEKKKIVAAKLPAQGPPSGQVFGKIKIIADEINNALVILATPQDYKIIERAIKALDIMPREALLEVLVAEVTLRGSIEQGVEWWLKKRGVDVGRMHVSLGGEPPEPEGFKPSKALSLYFGSLSENVLSLLTLLSDISEVNVIASPTVLAIDHQEASIMVGGEVPTLAQTVTGIEAAAGQVASSVEYKPYGIILTVTPHISSSGVVRMEVKQEYSNYYETKVAGQDSFRFEERTVETNLVAKDGQTVVIGGLIQTKIEKTRSGVPLLMDIPILRHLFSSNTYKKDKTEVLISITPHVIKRGKTAVQVSEAFLDKVKGLKKLLEKK